MQSDYARGRGKPAGPTRPPGMPSTWTRSTAVPGLPIVHIIRDGRDVVASHRDRWGSLSALKAVRKWPWYVRAARAAGARLSAEGRYYEVRYEDLVTDPETTLHKLLDSSASRGTTPCCSTTACHTMCNRVTSPSARRAGPPRVNMWRSTAPGSGAAGVNSARCCPLLVRLVDGPTLRELGYI
jgi:hypothetical protein